MSQKKLRWGLIGASNIAKEWLVGSITRHAACEVVSVYSRDPDRAIEYAGALGLRSHHSSLEELLQDPGIDAVYISTTNEKHRDEAVAAAGAGKHILCEKPIALSVDEARSMIDAAERAKVVLATNHHLRNFQSHLTIRDLIRSGKLGQITSARMSFTVSLSAELQRWRLHKPEAGAGVFLDLSVHVLDLLRFYFDRDPVAVNGFAVTSGNTSAGVEDNVATVWEFPDNLLVTCQESFLVPHGGTCVEIRGTKGSLFGTDVFERKSHRLLLKDENGETNLGVEYTNPYDKTIDDFVMAVRGEGTPTATGLDGLHSLRLALAAREAAATGTTIRL